MNCPNCESLKRMVPTMRDYRIELIVDLLMMDNIIIKRCDGYSCSECDHFVPKAYENNLQQSSFFNLIAVNILCQPFPLTFLEKKFLCIITKLTPVDVGCLAMTENYDGSADATLKALRLGTYLLNTKDRLTIVMEGLLRLKILLKLLANESEPELYLPLYQKVIHALEATMLSAQEERFEIHINLSAPDDLKFLILEQASA